MHSVARLRSSVLAAFVICTLTAVMAAPSAFASPIASSGSGGLAHRQFGTRSRMSASAVRALDDIPGTVETFPFAVSGTGSAISPTGWDNVYKVHLTAGQTYWFWLDGPAGTANDFDLYMFDPTATTVEPNVIGYDEDTLIDGSAVDGSQEWFNHYADATGDYYIDVWAGLGSGSFTLHGDVLSHQDADADVPGAVMEASLPFTASDSLTPGTDAQDAYKVSLAAGQSVKCFMTGQAGTDFSLLLFPPSTTAFWSADLPVQGAVSSGTQYESMFYTADTAGYYYPFVYMFWHEKLPHPGGGTYTLAMTTASTFPTSISIKTNLSSVKLPKPFELSGVLANGMAGDPCVVEVKKPGSGRWSYSSARLVYSISSTSGGSWWYRYTPKARGTFTFRVRYAGDGGGRPACVSKQITVKVS